MTARNRREVIGGMSAAALLGAMPLREGSVVEVHIEGIGTLRTHYGLKQEKDAAR